MTFKRAIEKLTGENGLSAGESQTLFETLFDGGLTEGQIAFLLGILRMRGEGENDLLGAARALRSRGLFIDCSGRSAVDTCGTGGDGAQTFNISTTAAFIAAGAGVCIAKHGNRAVSGKCGSADVLAQLGFNLDTPPERMERAIAQIGIGFLFAPKMHPVLKRVGSLRRELQTRTLFNMVGPLANPAGATGQVLGVFAPHLTQIYAQALKELGCKRAFVVHALEGLDEIGVCSETRVSQLLGGEIKTYTLYPEMLLGESFAPGSLAGGNAAQNAVILRDILEGKEQGARRACALINAAAAIVAGGLCDTLKEGLERANESLDSRRALQKLEQLIQASLS